MKSIAVVSLLVYIIFSVIGCSPGMNMTGREKIAAINTMAENTLGKLYAEKSSVEHEISKAPGYAVFSNANVNLVVASAGGGYGVLVDNNTGKRTYMKMGMGGVGVGLGLKDFRQVLVFKSKEAMWDFIYNGWDFGGQADATAKSGNKGVEASKEGYAGDVKVYTMTEAGLALQASFNGIKYWMDNDLN